ncbi:hypothetical protein GGS23DRAFT_601896 [Durotheca rogersii]|uniref:uncharacterized protein n=1 Tax=Durotheca rogersii TaxID=419775 RepID=UPI0022201F38|nr:uncharacterized protein GGS23DRAFT_601896 [Durotheca rogersii]KAI5867884.1 hypothetical protein GGS23DRAFT_601896 [Durotheca rogersii]
MAFKRKVNDFIYTLSDNDELSSPEEFLPESPPPPKKVKRNKQSALVDHVEEDSVWGGKEEDDGAMDSSFEFAENGTVDFNAEDLEDWCFDGAKKSIVGLATRRIVDVDEIVRRRRGTGEGVDVDTNCGTEETTYEASDEEDDIDLDDRFDEVLAADGFGMGAALGEESGGEIAEEQSGQEEQDDDASDDDSVATPVDHPDDAVESDDTGDREDPEEAARREAFFAPEDKTSHAKQTGKTSFQNMSLSRPILRGLNSVGFGEPTPIQARTIPLALEGKDLVGGAVTGSGKTAAFVVPILERLLYRPNKIPTSRVVILTPTRELAIQCHAVATKLASHTDIKFCLAVGGLSLKVQEAELRLRPDVIIATPGRFIDHMRNSPSFSADTVEILVLDEADRMLEDGFADELNEILSALPKSRQTMLFSATMTSSVDRLIRAGLNKPVRVMVDSQKKTVDKLEQMFVRLRPGREEKRMGYLIQICKTMHTERVIIFFRQKKEAHRARIIFALLNLSCAELHGSMNQTQRISSVEAFRRGKVSFLLATDLASRGLDIKGVETVINYEGPQTLEVYVHRVGRTARAGRSGVAITLAAEPDRKVVKAVVKAGKAQGAKISSLIIDPGEADKWQAKVEAMSDEIEAIAKEEKEEKQLAQAEMQIKKGENMVMHEEEIKSRPKRTWFETQHEKKKAKDAGRAELNGFKESLKKKGDGKLSNKDKKKLDARSARTEGMWKKGSAERGGRGAVLNFKGNGKKKARKDGKRMLPRGTLAPLPMPRALRLAPPRRFVLPRPHPHRRQSLLQYIFPRSLRERYRERLISFHLDTFPYYKHHIQSRIYRFILDRQRRRRGQPRLVDYVRRLLLGLTGSNKDAKNVAGTLTGKMTSVPGYGTERGDLGAEGGRERGARRRILAAMAGSVYRAGASAVNEIKESYYQTKIQDIGTPGSPKTTIPESFPHVAVVTNGNEQMVLFPSYAKRHVSQRSRKMDSPGGSPYSSPVDTNEREYWRGDLPQHENEDAVVDVDVRGWIYNPHREPMTRGNRILVGLARQLAGIPAPRLQQAGASTNTEPPLPSTYRQREEDIERNRIAREAREIERRGQAEEEVAQVGGYSERPRDEDSEGEGNLRYHNGRKQNGSQTPPSPASPVLGARTNTPGGADLTNAELAIANANLMARVSPFLTTPLVQVPITLFFYNDSQSQSRTVFTDESGHFTVRAALEFVPTHVRVLASEDLSATESVEIIEPRGVSLISDIDDTVKRSNIFLGSKEMFRNTFTRDLNSQTVDGVSRWYNALQDLGVRIHYCSNSPWQLYPVLATFLKVAGLPLDSLHLKRYTGMLQGIFEPVAERKRGTLVKIMKDFPERKFLLVGDSGEADLEVYTELAVAYPGRILAIFIRDVSTPEKTGYFDSGFSVQSANELFTKPPLPSRAATTPRVSGTVSGDLIDLSEKPEPPRRTRTSRAENPEMPDSARSSTRATDLLARRPPPKPAKPSSLQGTPALAMRTTDGPSNTGEINKKTLAPPQPRKTSHANSQSAPGKAVSPHPLTQMQNLSDQIIGNEKVRLENNQRGGITLPVTPGSAPLPRGIMPPPPPPRRRGPLSSSETITATATTSTIGLVTHIGPRTSPRPTIGNRRLAGNSDLDSLDSLQLPPAVAPDFSAYDGRSSSSSVNGGSLGSGAASPVAGMGAPNKKADLWLRRLQRAQEALDHQGVVLYTWRRGDEVVKEAVGIVKAWLLEEGGR